MRSLVTGWLVLLGTVVVVSLPQIRAEEVKTPSAPASVESVRHFIPDNAVAALWARPSSLINDTEFAILSDITFLKQTPVPPSEIEEVAAWLELDIEHAEPVPYLAIRFRKPINSGLLVKWLSPGAERVLGRPFPVFRKSQHGFDLAVVDARTVLMLQEVEGLDALLEGSTRPLANRSLVSRLANVDPATNIAVSADCGRVRFLIDRLSVDPSPESFEDLALSLPHELGWITVAGQFGRKNNNLRIEFAKRTDVDDTKVLERWSPDAAVALQRFVRWGAALMERRLASDDDAIVKRLESQINDYLKGLQPEPAGGLSRLADHALPSISRSMRAAAEVMVPFVMLARNAARESQRRNNLKHMGLVWHSFLDKTGRPPANIVDPQGKPLLSWRVRILPFIAQDELFKQFRLEESWDSDHNRKLLPLMPAVFRDVSIQKEQSSTHLQCVTGPRTIFGESAGLRQVTDGLSNTVLFVEAAQAVEWTKPADFEPPAREIYEKLLTTPDGEALLAFADGAVQRHPRLSDETYRRLFNFADGNVINLAPPDQSAERKAPEESLEKCFDRLSKIDVEDRKSVRNLLRDIQFFLVEEFGKVVAQEGITGVAADPRVKADNKKLRSTAQKQLVRFLKSRDAYVRSWSAELYLQICPRGELGNSPVAELLNDPNPDLRRLVTQTLGNSNRGPVGDRVKEVELAWLNFQDANSRFPSDIKGPDGKPLLSWRVRVLPLLEQKELYDRFHLDEPWDSAHNRQLIAAMPSVYRYTLPKELEHATRLQAVTGKGTIAGDGALLRQVTDGLSGTLLLVESATPVVWSKPGDFDIPATNIEGQLYRAPDGRIALGIADGSVQRVDKVSDTVFRRAATYAGGEVNAIAERDGLWRTAQKLITQNDPAGAGAAARKMLTLEEQLFGETSDDVLQSLDWLSRVSTRAEDFPAARADLALLSERTGKRYGADHWRAITSRTEVQTFDQERKLTADQREILKKSGEMGKQVGEQLQQGQTAKALEISAERLALVESVYGKESPIVLAILRDLRFLEARIGNIKAAATVAKRILDMAIGAFGRESPQAVEDSAEYALLISLDGQHEPAEKRLRDALDILLTLKKPELVRRATRYLAERSIQRGDLEKAYADYGEVLRATDGLGQADESVLLGSQFSEQLALAGSADLAKLVLFESIWRAELSPKPLQFRFLYGTLADYMAQHGYPHLELTLRQVHLQLIERALPEKTVTISEYATALLKRGQISLSLGDFINAERFCGYVMNVLRESNKEAQVPVPVLLAFARIEGFRNDIARAETLLSKALQVAESASVKPTSAVWECHRQLGEFLKHQSRLKDALPHFKALASRVSDGSAQLQIDRIQYARLLQETGEDAAAREMARQLHKETVYPKTLAQFDHRVAQELADLMWLCNERKEAEQWSGRAVESCLARHGIESQLYAESLCRSAVVAQKCGQQDLARKRSHEALQCASQILDRSMYILSPRQQMLLREHMRQSLDVFLTVAARDPSHSRETFEVIYFWKGMAQLRQRRLQDLMQKADVKDFFSQLQSTTQRLTRATHQAADRPANADLAQVQVLEQQAQALSDFKELLEQQLSAAQLAYLDIEQSQTLKEFVEAIPRDAAFVDYFTYRQSTGAVGEDEYSLVATIVKPGGVFRMIPLGPLAPVQADIAVWRTSYGRSSEGEQAGLALRKRLWEPLLADFAGAKLLLISPDSALGQLPFSALPGQKPGSYLLQDHRLVMIPVPQLIASTLRPVETKAAEALLLVGDIDYEKAAVKGDAPPPSSERGILALVRSGHTFGALPGTAAELLGIAQLARKDKNFKDDAVKTLTRRDATESTFRSMAPHYRIVHVATHGFFAEAPPRPESTAQKSDVEFALTRSGTLADYHPGLLSGIAFAGANHDDPQQADDGILTADEIAGLPLSNLSLAVLSACETGIGQLTHGDGLIGVQRAFQIAGARSTIASLWKVNDKATQVLMTRFYQNLLDGNKDRLDALRDAQLWMLDHPDQVWAKSAEEIRGARREKNAKGKDDAKSSQLSPEFWAAFVLSGDWK